MRFKKNPARDALPGRPNGLNDHPVTIGILSFLCTCMVLGGTVTIFEGQSSLAIAPASSASDT